jgi:hypothetical protein
MHDTACCNFTPSRAAIAANFAAFKASGNQLLSALLLTEAHASKKVHCKVDSGSFCLMCDGKFLTHDGCLALQQCFSNLPATTMPLPLLHEDVGIVSCTHASQIYTWYLCDAIRQLPKHASLNSGNGRDVLATGAHALANNIQSPPQQSQWTREQHICLNCVLKD